MATIATAGNKGKSVRSDCFVSLELTTKGSIEIDLTSKVKNLFGDAITATCHEVLHFYGIEHAIVTIEDSGALDYVLAARLEYAIKQLTGTGKEFLPRMLPQNTYATARDRYRRSRLYLPGNTPKLAINAGLHHPDGLILDLEDSVAPAKKDEARILVRNTLLACDFYGTERMVRINQMPLGLDDLEMMIPHNVNLVLLPKCESADEIKALETKIEGVKTKHNCNNPVWIMPIIESALGVMKAYEIATASEHVVALAIGLEDYTADLGTQRTREGTESFFARCMLVNAARAAGIQAIDSVFSDVSNMEALRQNVLTSKSLGFDGMGCIHPRQIPIIHDAFAPNDKEIDKAQKIVNAFYKAEEQGLGVVSLGSKMIDPPVVKRAQRTIHMAIEAKKISADWRESYGK
ncbi:MAG: citrate lyase acyl carrier protein [Candidatus Cloacimonetes bacterium]|nr:citrate lyase acyl carrier protein [Candidatus Cloacimonadota bacterium]